METPLKIAIENQNQPAAAKTVRILEDDVIETMDRLIQATRSACVARAIETTELETAVDRYSADNDPTETFAVLGKLVKALNLNR